MEPTIVAAWIGALATASAALIGFGAIYWQIGRQSELNRKNVIESQSREMKMRLYQEGLSKARAFADASSNFLVRLATTRTELQIIKAARAAGLPAPIPSSRFPQFLRLNEELSDAQSQFVFLIENNRILDSRLTIFRDVCSMVSHQLTAITTLEFPTNVMRALPVDRPEGGIYGYDLPMDEQIDAAIRSIDTATDLLSDHISHAEDFIVEIQNLTMGDVFNNSVEHRTPIDPSRKVIRLTDDAELKEWIAKSPWGLHCNQIEEKSRAMTEGGFKG